MDTTDKDSHIITENDISASLKLKEEINDELDDSVSLEGSQQGSCSSVGTLSGISTGSAMSLTALKQKRNVLIDSIKSALDASCLGKECSTPNTSFALDDHPLTSTPCQENNVPPAATFLKDWRCFSKIEEIDDEDDSLEPPVKYEEAFKSLKEILGENEDQLGAYESSLDVYQKKEDKKLEEMMSFFEKEKQDDVTSKIDNCTVIDLMSSGLDDNDNTIIPVSDSSTILANETVIEKPQILTDEGRENRKELDPKDPENVIIAAEDGANADVTLVNEEDEDRLLASDDEEQGPAVATVEPKKGWTEFVSNDPEENADNNDPQWERLRNLGSDYERYLAVRQRWKNIDIPNPKKDLTCRCRRTVETSMPISQTASRKRPHSPDSNFNSKRLKVEPCTMLFDRSITKALTDLELQKQMLEKEQARSQNSLAKNQRLEKILAYHRRAGELETRALNERHWKETVDLMRNFHMRREHLLHSSRQKIAALRRAAAEVQEFHEFYPASEESGGKNDKKSLTYLTGIEVEEILEIESMFTRFEEFYSSRRYEQQC